MEWVSNSWHKPDEEDVYYIWPTKYEFAAFYHKYGPFAGKWTISDQNGYDYEINVDYWKAITPPEE